MTVEVVCLGPPAADDVLRDAIAVGADSVTRIDAAPDLDSATVATALAQQLHGADLVVCGDASVDRGTGSVPAYLAGELGCVAGARPRPGRGAIDAGAGTGTDDASSCGSPAASTAGAARCSTSGCRR